MYTTLTVLGCLNRLSRSQIPPALGLLLHLSTCVYTHIRAALLDNWGAPMYRDPEVCVLVIREQLTRGAVMSAFFFSHAEASGD